MVRLALPSTTLRDSELSRTVTIFDRWSGLAKEFLSESPRMGTFRTYELRTAVGGRLHSGAILFTIKIVEKPSQPYVTK
jgi:hypothetical protein